MDEAWIQQSLSRLETLESYKAQVQASGQAVDLSEVDAEIAALYEVLESAAEPEPAAQPEPATPFAASSPFEQPAYAPPVSPAMHAQAAPMSAPSYEPSMSMSYADVDVDAPKSKAPFIAVGLLAVLGLGTGGWYVSGRGEPPPAAAPAGDPTVINASSIPSDTQEPQVAKGGDATRTEGLKIKESNRPAPRGNHDRRGPAPRASDRPSPKKSGKDDRKVATIDDSRDPLAGAR